MPRRRRFDAPGLLHHVMNPGIARRTAFESRRDVRYALLLLALEVRAGRIGLLAFAILTTHFHLLLRAVPVSSTASWATPLLANVTLPTSAASGCDSMQRR